MSADKYLSMFLHQMEAIVYIFHIHHDSHCFFLLHNQGSGKTTLAKKLARAWKCELINGKYICLESSIRVDRNNITDSTYMYLKYL